MVKRDYATVMPDEAMEDDCRQLIRLAVREDLDRSLDWTTVRLIDPDLRGRCEVVSRKPGVCAGLVTAPWVVSEMDADLKLTAHLSDGARLSVGQPILTVEGNARDLDESIRRTTRRDRGQVIRHPQNDAGLAKTRKVCGQSRWRP
jgi:nicotinate-nucleotide pyrophosphorylase (carboxylating)